MKRTTGPVVLVAALAAFALATAVAHARPARPMPSAGQHWVVSGKATGVDQANRVISLAGTTTVVTFSEDTTFYGARERAYITSHDVNRRDIIHAAGAFTEPGTVAATWINVIHPPAMVTGRITAIDRDTQTITLYKNRRWPAVVVHYSDRTRVKVPGKHGVRTVGVLAVGMRVKSFGYRKGMEIHSNWIKILRHRSRHWSGSSAHRGGRRR